MRYGILVFFLLWGCSARNTENTMHGTVTKIVTGNTVELTTANGEVISVRILGISAPKLEPRTMFFPSTMDPADERVWAKKAIDFTNKHLLDKKVTIMSHTTTFKEDRHGRTLAFVMIGKRDFSELIARAGLAWVYSPTFEPNLMTRRSPIYQQAEAEARQERLGMWAVLE